MSSEDSQSGGASMAPEDATAPPSVGPPSSARSALRVVAIGASAGGLEPFEQLFGAMRADTGLAFVVIQHLSPDFRSLMDELLARHSAMSIVKVENGMALRPNTIYLNPPRHTMTIRGGAFVLEPWPQPEALNLPINAFFESLAEEMGAAAIGVILSGTGSDGTKGCDAIKRAGGVVLVQQPTTAKFDGMPNSVINLGIADAIAPAEALPDLIACAADGQSLAAPADENSLSDDPNEAIYQIMRKRFGTDFHYYKRITLDRRVDRRREIARCPTLHDYVMLLAEDQREVEALYNDLLIEVTAFFRDRDAFELLENAVVPSIGAAMSEDHQIRIWVPGCASGEEAYSIAILFSEFARTRNIPLNVKILATDIHHRSLEAASAGIFAAESLRSMPEDRIERYFERVGDYFQVRAKVRRLVVFSPHDILRDPPFTRMDLVSCRNVLIYLTDVAQRKTLSLFHFSLRKGGYLFLGPSETVGALGAEFRTIDRRWRIFQKQRDVRLLDSTSLLPRGPEARRPRVPDFTSASSAGPGSTAEALVERGQRARAIHEGLQQLLARYAPAGFLLGKSGELIQVFGDAGAILKVAAGTFTNNILELLPEHLRLTVNAGLDRMQSGVVAPFERAITVNEPDGSVTSLGVKLEPLSLSGRSVDYALLTIETRTQAPPRPAAEEGDQTLAVATAAEIAFYQERIRDLERDLQSTEESLQTTIEELETSNEELQATNEELMASNEELQSTNEELHSVNEELYTVSAEHQRKIEELTQLTGDMDHLLKSTGVGTIFLDANNVIRRFTPAAAETFNLIAQDVGRPVSHVTYRFEAEDFIQRLEEARINRRIYEREISVGGKAYFLRVLPYEGGADQAEGVVITIIGVQALKEAEAAVAEQARRFGQILADTGDFILRWNADDRVVTYCNPQFLDTFAAKDGSAVGRTIDRVLTEGRAEALLTPSVEAAAAPGALVAFRMNRSRKNRQTEWFEGTVRAIGDSSGRVTEFQATGRDVSEAVRKREALEQLIAETGQSNPDYDAQLNHFLEIGAAFLGLEHGVISRFEGDAARIDAYHGPRSGDDLKGAHLSSHAATDASRRDKDAVAAMADAPADAIPHKLFGDIRAFLNAPVSVRKVPRGALSFFSQKARGRPFTEDEEDFILLLARWIAYKLERREQLAEIQRRESEIRLIFNNVPARIWYKDDQNRILRLNERAAEAMGVTLAEAEGGDAYRLLPETAKEHHEDDLAVLEAGAPKYGSVEEFTRPGGAIGWLQTDKVPFIDPVTGQRSLLVVSSDITELKEQQQELEKLSAALEQQRRSYFNLYRKTPIMMHSISADGRLIEVSDHWLDKLGYNREEVIGRDSTDFLTADSQILSKETLEGFWNNGYCWAVPYQFVRKDGTTIDIELSGVVDDTNPDGQRSLGVLIDVTDRNQAIAIMEEKNIELERANEGLEQFAYAASHDLKEPLRKIQQFGEMLSEEFGDRLDGDGPFYLDVMTTSAARMARLIADLLAFSRASNQNPKMTRSDLTELAQSAADHLETHIAEAGATVAISPLPEAECDATMIEQVFHNLIANAVKYRRPERALHISIGARPSARGHEIFVKDNGSGFDPAHAERVFEPFTRLQRSADTEGSGVGLAICRSVCVRHGWSIRVETALGEGAEFILEVRKQLE